VRSGHRFDAVTKPPEAKLGGYSNGVGQECCSRSMGRRRTRAGTEALRLRRQLPPQGTLENPRYLLHHGLGSCSDPLQFQAVVSVKWWKSRGASRITRARDWRGLLIDMHEAPPDPCYRGQSLRRSLPPLHGYYAGSLALAGTGGRL
jgi:hypothetical protein